MIPTLLKQRQAVEPEKSYQLAATVPHAFTPTYHH